MAHDPELVAEVRAWLWKAARDLAAAAYELEAESPFTADASFHCQQAVEKAFKGFLAWHSCPFRKTHNLEELGEQCLKLDTALKEIIDLATPLTQYAWKFRYPGEPHEPPVEEAQEALMIGRAVYEALVKRLPEEVASG
jgi:HEPN domain-containing protein